MNILLFIQAIIGLLLIIVIFMQKSGVDGLSGLQGSPTNTGIISAASVALNEWDASSYMDDNKIKGHILLPI